MKQGLSMGARALSSYLVIMILNLLVGLGMGDNLYWLQIVLNVVLLLGMGMMMWSDGGYRGERAATMTATVERLREEGKQPDADMIAKSFSKRVAFIGYLVGIIPLVLMATVNLVVEPMYPPVIVQELSDQELDELNQAMNEAMVKSMGVTDSEAGETAPEEGKETAATDDAAVASNETRVNVVNVIARIVYMPIVALYKLFGQNPHGLNLIFLALSIVYAIPESVGYLMGPALRKKKLTDIEKGKKRKMRNLKVNKKPRQTKQPKMEV